MGQNLLSDLRLYVQLIRMQIRSQMQYKTNMVFDIITGFAIVSLEFAALLLFFVPFPTILGWTIGEITLLAGIISLSFALAELAGSGLDAFARVIRMGEFDRVLLRPASALIQILGSEFTIRRLGRFLQGLLALWLAFYLLPGVSLSLDKVLVLVLGVLSGMLVFCAILLLGATICFWSVETTEISNLLFYGGREMLSYPISIYDQALQRIFTFVVPIAFGSYVPTCYILGRPLPFDLPAWLAFTSPLVALLFTCVVFLFWMYGVRHYQSTGS